MPNDLASPHVAGRHPVTPPRQESLGQRELVGSYLRGAAGGGMIPFQKLLHSLAFHSFFLGRFGRADSEYLVRYKKYFVDHTEELNIFGK